MLRHHGAAEPRGLQAVPQSPLPQGLFGRMFRKLPAQRPHDDLLAFLAAAMIEAEGAGPELDNPDIPVGYTYLGQFIDHDITFDPTSKLQRLNDPNALRNFRTPRFDLDSLYASGPIDSPFLYENVGEFVGVKLLVGRNPGERRPGGVEERDLPRNWQGRALVGDPRNDENNIVSQLQLAFIDFHNAVVERVHEEEKLEGQALFEEAQRQVRWHYQWVVVHDFLKRLVGEKLFSQIYIERQLLDQAHEGDGELDATDNFETNVPQIIRKFYDWQNQPFMPVEFSGAAYRFGHSQIRPSYNLNEGVPDRLIFHPDGDSDPLADLRGFRPLPFAWTLDWSFFFQIGDRTPQFTRLINPTIAPGLASLPPTVDGERRSLVFLNLRRGKALGLPSGQAVARSMGLRPLSSRQLNLDALTVRDDLLGELQARKDQLKTQMVRSFSRNTPLWFYILKEAQVLGDGGKRLGPVGGRIVAEVLLGLLEGDPLSYLNVEPNWEPTLEVDGQRLGRNFEMAHLLRVAGVTIS
jgi:hypothetical protein